MPVVIKQSDSEISEIIKLLESHPATIRSYRTGNLLGVLIGGLALLSGFAAFLLGLTGSIDLFFKSESVSMRMINASPGGMMAVIGLVVMVIFKPRVRSEIEIQIKESNKVNPSAEHKREISVRQTDVGSSSALTAPRFPWK